MAACDAHPVERLAYVERQSQYLQRRLQQLIDAQSEGLYSGFAQPFQQIDRFEDSTVGPQATGPSGQHANQRIGLRAARMGVSKSMLELLRLREEEREILSSEMSERQDALDAIEAFDSKKSGLQNAISSIRSRQENLHCQNLQRKARTLETEIHELETQLYEKKAAHRHIVDQLSHIENRVEASVSSYTASLDLLKSEIHDFLRNPPIQPLAGDNGDSTFYSLKAKRRTLEMAGDYWTAEKSELRQRQQKVDAEIRALAEGSGVWKSVVEAVNGFEKRLQANLQQIALPEAQVTGSDRTGRLKSGERLIDGIVGDLEDITRKIETQLELAEDKDWKLLVCCIGAELEALREAREKLLPTELSPNDEAPKPESASSNHNHDDQVSQAGSLGNDNSEPPADLLQDGNAHDVERTSKSEHSDGEPDPAWLLSGA